MQSPHQIHKLNWKLISLLILVISLPVLSVVTHIRQENRSHAAAPDALEMEGGVFSGNATKQTDSNASGGSYILFGNNSQSNNGVYGAGINIDSKDNKRIGAASNVKVSHRFRASTTSKINSIAWALRGGVNPDGSPYSAGTGGSLRISVQTDDGTINHNPSGTILASLNFTPGNPNGGGTVKQDFPNPATLTAGTIYHIVWENTDPNPTANYISINEIFTYKKYTPRQPILSDADYSVLYNQGSGWNLQANDTADMDIIYADGKHDGLAYMQAMPETDKTGLIGGNNLVREHFTVSDSNHTVSSAFVRVGKQNGTGNMTIALKNGTTILGSGTVPASSIITSVIGDGAAAANGDWISINFANPITLTKGQTYDLTLSAPSGNQFSMVPIRHTDDFSVALNSWAFREGTGQRSTDNGTTWSNLYAFSPVNTQFYFTTTQPQTQTPDVTININRNQTAFTSNMAVGVTHIFGGIGISGLDPAAKTSAMNLIANGVKYQNRHIYGWGLGNPNPSPGVYNWSDLDKAMKIISDSGGTPVITLCCSPGWMTTLNTTTDNAMDPNYAPTPAHYADFANLTRQIALRYPNVKYYQVWNELKGFNWDINAYTSMYNMVYDTLKSVDPNIKVGGPYITHISGTDAKPIPDWILNKYKYFFANKHGLDFISVDYSIVDFNDSNIPAPEVIISKTDNFNRLISQVKSVPGYNNEPFWWAEDYALSNQGNLDNISNDAQAAFLASMLYHEMQAGSNVSLRWSPGGDNSVKPQSNIESLFTDPRAVGGGQPYPSYAVYKAFNDYFKPGTAIYTVTNSDTGKIEVVSSANKTMLINKTPNSLVVSVNGNNQTVGGFKVALINTP